MNSLIIEGEIKAVSALEKKENGTSVCTFYFTASNNGYDYNFEVESYGETADQVFKSGEGRIARIVGRLVQKKWTDDTGKKHSKVVIVAEYVELKNEK